MDNLAQLSKPVVVMPAYGRQYKTSQEAYAAWKSGKDFKIVNGPYCSVRDIQKLHASSVWVDLVTTLVRVE